MNIYFGVEGEKLYKPSLIVGPIMYPLLLDCNIPLCVATCVYSFVCRSLLTNRDFDPILIPDPKHEKMDWRGGNPLTNIDFIERA